MATNEDIDIATAAHFWAYEFTQMVDETEVYFRYWMTAREKLHACADPDEHAALAEKCQDFHCRYNGKRAALYRWVVTHPAPEGAIDL